MTLVAGFVALINGIRRAPKGFQDTSGFSFGDETFPEAIPMNTSRYRQIGSGLDQLLVVFSEPGSELTSEDLDLRDQLLALRARTLIAESAHPFA